MALSQLAAPARATRAGAPPTWWSPRTWERSDRRCVALLAAVPVALFVLPALLGHPAIVGDNLLQNFPLRVLTGRELDAGHWPVWNVYADSGTPLLGGMNAGAMYPGTLLFAVAPGVLAWVANLLVVYWVAAVGLFVLARTLGAGTTASGLAAATYAYSGAMVGQLVHLGVVQGQAWLPWIVLSQLALARAVLSGPRGVRWRVTARRALPATLGLAACVGLVCLTGEPRAIADAGVVVVVLGVVELVAHASTEVATVRGRVAYLVATVLGATWGLAIGFVQLAPGVGFVSLTRRAHVSYAFFSMGAWPTRWLALLFVPGALGDNGVAATPRFFASYNLPEVTGAVGLAAMTAVFAAIARLCSKRSRVGTRRRAAFLALCAAGVLLAVAPATGLGPLLYHVPLLSSTRLQSRSIAIFDLGATVLLAWWLDAVLHGRTDEAALVGPRRAITLAPLWATVAVCVLALLDPGWVTQSLLGASGTAHAASGIRTSVAVTLAIAVAYLVVLRRRPQGRSTSARALLAVALVELVCFNVLFETALVTGISTVEPSRAAAVAALGDAGRTALVDPGVVAYHETAPIGLGNLNVFTRLPSVQGYGSLHAARYTDATGTARLGELDGCALAHGAFAPLRLSGVAVAPTGFQSTTESDRFATTCGRVRTRTVVTRYFGGDLPVARVSFAAPGTSSLVAPRAMVWLLGTRGQVLSVPVSLHPGRDLVAVFPTHPLAVAAVLGAPLGVAVGSTTLTTATGATLQLDTAMQVALDTAAWRLVDQRGSLTFFRATRVAPPVWLVRPAPGATARLVAAHEDGSASVVVASTAPVRLVRSETWLPGWGATLVGEGTSRTAAVVPDGLVQSVVVPAGTWTVEFAYHAPHLRLGLVVSAVALLAVLCALVVLARRRLGGRGTPIAVR